MLLSFHIFGDFHIFLLLVSNLIPLWSENIFCPGDSLLLETCSWTRMCSVLVNVRCVNSGTPYKYRLEQVGRQGRACMPRSWDRLPACPGHPRGAPKPLPRAAALSGSPARRWRFAACVCERHGPRRPARLSSALAGPLRHCGRPRLVPGRAPGPGVCSAAHAAAQWSLG